VTAAAPAAATAAQRRSAFGLFAVVLGLLGLSLGSTIVKEIGAPGITTAAWRMVFGTAIWMVVLHARGGRLSTRAVRLAGPSAFFFAADIALFFIAVTKTSVANAEFIGSLVPVVVVPLAAALFHEHLRLASLAWGGVALGGVAVILFSAPSSGVSSSTGNALAFVAMCMWAGYLLSARRARATLGTTEFVTTVATLAACLLVPVAAIGGKLWEVPAGGWKYIVLLAVLTGTVCHGLLAWAQTRIPVSTISILQVGNPALASLWAFLILGETVNGQQAAGMAVVIGALIAFIVSSRRAVPSVLDNGELGGPSG
jgi:drug/metabolite transporter (DMT)-like permease